MLRKLIFNDEDISMLGRKILKMYLLENPRNLRLHILNSIKFGVKEPWGIECTAGIERER
jgi:hypothetical protein